eukprot:gene12239-2874_t
MEERSSHGEEYRLMGGGQYVYGGERSVHGGGVFVLMEEEYASHREEEYCPYGEEEYVLMEEG